MRNLFVLGECTYAGAMKAEQSDLSASHDAIAYIPSLKKLVLIERELSW